MTSEIAKIQTLDVAGAASVLTEYTDRLEKAKTAAQGLETLEYSLETKPKFDGFVAAVKLRSTELETKRKPFTAELNAVIKLFTTAEKGFLDLATPILEKEKEWKRKERAAQDLALAEQAKTATRTRVIAEFIPKVEALLIDFAYDAKVSYLSALERGEEPVIFQMEPVTWQGLCKRAMAAIGGTDFQAELAAAIAPTKEELIIKYTKEVHEWQADTLKSKGNIKALQNIGKLMGLAYTEAVVEVVDKAEAAKVEAEIEIHETAQVAAPVVQIGTKFIPTPANLKEVQEIFRHWLVEANPTVEEAFALIGKAATMCKREALKGNRWAGVTYIEDVK